MRLLFYTIMEEDSSKICTSSGMKNNQSVFIWYFGFNFALAAEFKRYINAYLKELLVSPVHSLADLIALHEKNSKLVALSNLAKLTRDVTPGKLFSRVLAIGGFPGVIDHAGYNSDGEAFGLCFGGLERSEPKLIEITYGFEQATRIRKPPKLKT
ncbi:putative amidase [Quercus suber]|uniref:Amidase n=1 Tax=Quercus suber TaxID=58331 RepID=A0AAW0ITV1_QUESU